MTTWSTCTAPSCWPGCSTRRSGASTAWARPRSWSAPRATRARRSARRGRSGRAHDVVLPYYRDLGVALTLGMSRLRDPAGGLRPGRRPQLRRAADAQPLGQQATGHHLGSSPIATHIPHAAGIGLASKLRGDERVADLLLRRRRGVEGRLPRVVELRRHPPPPDRLHLREQRLRHLRTALEGVGGGEHRPTRALLRHAGDDRRRQRPARRLRHRARRRPPRPQGRRARRSSSARPTATWPTPPTTTTAPIARPRKSRCGARRTRYSG